MWGRHLQRPGPSSWRLVCAWISYSVFKLDGVVISRRCNTHLVGLACVVPVIHQNRRPLTSVVLANATLGPSHFSDRQSELAYATGNAALSVILGLAATGAGAHLPMVEIEEMAFLALSSCAALVVCA